MGQCMNGAFHPAWWCRGAHAQTLFGTLFRAKFRMRLNRKRIELEDGDFLDLDFLESSSSNGENNKPLIVILHGLEGSSRAPYVQTLLKEIHTHGWNAAAINMRACGGEPNRLTQTYHSGKTEDLEWAVRHLIEKERRQEIYLVGYSIGGNILLKWLGEQTNSIPPEVRRAAAISAPYDLTKSVELMDRGFNRRVYTRMLLRSLKAKIRFKEKQFPGAIRYERVKRCTTFKEFDREVTAPLNGFRNEEDYWAKTSCKNFLDSVTVPTLLIHAEDDPFFPARLIPLDVVQRSKHLYPLIVPCGGHLGFVTGQWPWKQEHWLEKKILEFFSNGKSDPAVCEGGQSDMEGRLVNARTFLTTRLA